MTNPHISSVHIEYSNLEPVNINDFSPELNVIFGKNETGKSRIRDFISWMLFANDTKYQSEKTKKISKVYKDTFSSIDEATKGEIKIFSNDESNTIYQQLAGSTIENKLTPVGLDLRHKLTDGISFENYSSIYSLSLDQINLAQSKNLLEDKSQLEYIFGAVKAKTSVSPALLIKTLKERCEFLFAESSSAKKEINAVLKQIDEIKKQLKTLKAESKQTGEVDIRVKELNVEKLKNKEKLEILEKLLITTKNQINGIEIYQEYKELSSESISDFNEKIVSEINEIDVHIKESKRLLNYENDLTELEKEKTEYEKEIERITARLDETLNPDSANPYILSHEFEAIIEDEIAFRASVKSTIESLKGEINSLNSNLRLLEKQISAQSKTIEPLKKETVSDQKKSNKNIYAFSLIGFFTALTIAGIVTSISAIAAIGATAVLATIISYVLYSQNEKIISASSLSPVSNNNQFLIEIDHNKSEIETREKELNQLQENLFLGSESYSSSCLKAGFEEKIEPKHVQKYIKDFELLSSIYTQLDKANKAVKSQRSRLEAFYLSLKELANRSNYSISTSHSFDSIAHAQNWLDTFNNFAHEQKALHTSAESYNNQIEKLENILLDQFESIEQAKHAYADQSFETLEEKLNELKTEIQIIKDEQENIITEIATINEQQKTLNKSTDIQDLILENEELITELTHLHNQYKLSYTSYKVAEKAFTKWQDNFQPEVNKKASILFSQMTNSKWDSVQTEIDSLNQPKNQMSLFSARNENFILDSTKLSRGASEQLYLSFRLAVMQTNKRAPFIPAMFDDVSVNFDKERFETIAPIISGIAKERQVFYFTCHEWVRDTLVSSAGAKVFNL